MFFQTSYNKPLLSNIVHLILYRAAFYPLKILNDKSLGDLRESETVTSVKGVDRDFILILYLIHENTLHLIQKIFYDRSSNSAAFCTLQ